jgi:hypothetical protein
LILLGFVSFARLPKRAPSGYNEPYFSRHMSHLSRHHSQAQTLRGRSSLIVDVMRPELPGIDTAGALDPQSLKALPTAGGLYWKGQRDGNNF